MSSAVLDLWAELCVSDCAGFVVFYTDRFEAHLFRKNQISGPRLFDANRPARYVQLPDASGTSTTSSVVSCSEDVPMLAGAAGSSFAVASSSTGGVSIEESASGSARRCNKRVNTS